MGSEINPSDKTQSQWEKSFFLFLLWGQGRVEILPCKQVTIEHRGPLITLLSDREMQLQPWEGNYSQNMQRANKIDGEGENCEGGGGKK